MNGILGNVWNNVFKPEVQGVLDYVSTTKEVELGADFDVSKAVFNSILSFIILLFCTLFNICYKLYNHFNFI